MLCDQIQKALAVLPGCVETELGSRFTTHCLYPSFESVSVYVVKSGKGFRVHDGGGAYRSVWEHTGDTSAVKGALEKQALNYGLKVQGDSVVCEAASSEWLFAALMSVANASAAAAYDIVVRARR